MIDYLKTSTENFDYEYLTNNPNFEFLTQINPITGEFFRNKHGTITSKGEYNGLVFKIKENLYGKRRLCIEGSLHKFYNNGEHNFDDFSINELHASIYYLCDILKIKPQHQIIRTVEFGVNISPPTRTMLILDGLILHKKKPFGITFGNNAYYNQVKHNNRILKYYDKALQYRKDYGLDQEILRLELKYTRMIELINMLVDKQLIMDNYLTMHDLKNAWVLEEFGKLLVKTWEEVLFYDYTIDDYNLTTKEKLKLDIWQNKIKWRDYPNYKRAYQKRLLTSVTEKHSNHIQKKVTLLIKEKVSQLLEIASPR